MDKQLFNDILLKVPGSFKAKLDRIRRYLHLGKASVMVGAGFSRNADVPAHVKVKQWNDVGEDIFCRLQAVEKADASDLVFKTPMRLASQFAAVNGRNELDNLIRDSIPDDRMSPSSLHYQLLNLPWRDVFTTNYDTLLERARKKLQRNYSVVTSREMLLYKPSPRIIKLHGSFPDKTPFLMTEEDFMTYPVEHPEFVNTVRQALVESIFCLVGFSGDDPNFTSWQAWLQDVMGEYAGPSYLITCDKHYDESFKTLMKQRGIEVVNFSEIDDLDDYKKALDFFFTFLSERGTDWQGNVEYDIGNINVKRFIAQMQVVRETYPGWFVLPKQYYSHFDDMQYRFPYLEKTFETIEEEDRENLLFELDWRADISLTFKDFDWYRTNLEKVISSYGENPFSEKAITLGVTLLRLYRHHLDKKEEAAAIRAKLDRELSRMTLFQQGKYYYTLACNALSVLDYDAVATVLKDWQPTAFDYVGVIYKALVIVECGERSEAIALLNEALENITLSLAQNTTQEEISLRCIMESLLSFYSGERMSETDHRFSFLELSNAIQYKIGQSNKELIETVHGFGVGATTRSWNMNSGVNKELFYPYRYLLLCESYGFPYGMATSTVDEKILETLLPQLVGFGIGYGLGPVLRSGSRKVTVSYLSRKALNLLSREQADTLARMLLSCSSQNSFEKARKRRNSEVLLPFLSRLSSSCNTEVVAEIFRFALSAYTDTYMSKPEDLRIIYSNTLSEGIQTVYSIVFESDIFSDIREQDLPLPQDAMNLYTPGSKAVDVVCEGLRSDDEHAKESAYLRAEKLLDANLQENDRQRLSDAIRKWRAGMSATNLTRASFNEVAPSEEERETIKKQVNEDVKRLVDGNYASDKSSIPISSLDADLRHITIEALYLATPQITSVLEKMAAVLDANYDAYAKDDSGDVFGGLRHFTLPVFRLLGEFVRVVTKNGYSETAPSAKLFKVLMRYLPTHLPVRLTMEQLNVICRVIGPNKMREIIAAQLLSDNETDVIDSCNALVSFAHHYTNYQKVFQNIIFYCKHAVNDRMRLYFQTLSMISIEKMTKTTQEQLANMMKSVLERIPLQDIPDESKVDIMHDGVRLAASLDGVSAPKELVEALTLWEDYAKSDQVYNDIRRPWFVR